MPHGRRRAPPRRRARLAGGRSGLAPGDRHPIPRLAGGGQPGRRSGAECRRARSGGGRRSPRSSGVRDAVSPAAGLRPRVLVAVALGWGLALALSVGSVVEGQGPLEEPPSRESLAGRVHAGAGALRAAGLRGRARAIRGGGDARSGPRRGHGAARLVPVLPRGVPGGRHHLQGRAPPPAEVERPPRRAGLEPAPLEALPPGDRGVPGCARSGPRLLRRLDRARLGAVRARTLRGGARPAREGAPADDADPHRGAGACRTPARSSPGPSTTSAATTRRSPPSARRCAPRPTGMGSTTGWAGPISRLGRKMEAQAAFRRALALQPDYEDAREGLRQASG